MQLKIVKADSSIEEYLHTKVVETFNNALSLIGNADTSPADELAEAVTYFLHNEQDADTVSSSDIFAMIKIVLSSAGHEDAASALNQRHLERQATRLMTEVLYADAQDIGDADIFSGPEGAPRRSQWDKSRIVADLIGKYDFFPQAARVIASMVEEKVIAMGMTSVPSSLVKQLVLNNAAAVMPAQEPFQTA